jgi:hypothetical protein
VLTGEKYVVVLENDEHKSILEELRLGERRVFGDRDHRR